MKFNKNEFGWKEKVSVNTNNSDKLDKVEFERMNLYNISSYESLIIQGYPLDMATYREDISNGDVYNKRYINVDKNISNIIDTNKDIIVSIIYEENGKKKIFNQVGYYSSMDYFKNTIYLPINNSSISIQVTLFKNKQYNENLELIDSEKCSILLSFGKKDEDTVKLLDSFEYRISIRNENVLTKTNIKEYTPTSDYHPATKKYVDDKFYMYENIETIYTIPMSEMQKCNNGTSMYVSSINFDELFINHEKYIYYANYKDDTLIPVTYDNKYNRFVTDTLDKVGNFDIILAFDLGTHKMYPFSGGLAEIKAYTFTNDLIIKRVPILDVNEVATKKYVDDSMIFTPLPCYKEEYLSDKMLCRYVNIMDLEPRKTYGGIHDVDNRIMITYKFMYVCDDNSEKNVINMAETINDRSIRIWHYNNYSNLCISEKRIKIDYTNHATSTDIIITNFIRDYITSTNRIEYTPTNDYNPATKKYVDDTIANQPTFSFNDSGELVVTINGVTKTFVPKQ